MENEEKNRIFGLINSFKLHLAHFIERQIIFLSGERDSDIDVDKNEHWGIKYPLLFLGNIYHIFKNTEERIRVWFYNFFEELSQIRILYEILYYSRQLIIFTFILLLSSFAILFTNKEIIYIIDKRFILELLTAYVGGATAILGIIFALYSVGFQTTTERFSSKITQYLNQEKVGQFFFKLLVLSAVFSLFNLILQRGIELPIIPPFLISTFLITVSLLGILIFKDDYMT
jgi:hypothetical protein